MLICLESYLQLNSETILYFFLLGSVHGFVFILK